MNPKLRVPALLSQPRIVTRDLVAQYTFDEGSGQVLKDRSGKGNNGRLGSTSGADANDPAWGAQRLTFAADDYVSCGSIGANSSFEFVILDCVGTAPLVGVSNAGGIYAGFTDGYARITLGVTHWRSFEWALCSGAHHIAATIPSSGASASALCVDGIAVPVRSTDVSGAAAARAWFDIGSASVYALGGSICYASVYSTILDTVEIAQNYKALKSMMANRGVALP